jgi:heptosyltransferase-2
LNELKGKGFVLIGVSNQSGISRGIVDEQFVKEVNQVFIDKYGFDDFYYCPHGPDENCSCRKPEPGMLLSARADHRINLKESYVVGDKDADMLLAKAVGAKGILVKTGKQQESAHADFVVESLKDVVDLIVSHE